MTRSSTRTAPVPVEDLFAPPEYARPTISPDGRRLAFLAPWRTRLNVWVLDVEEHGLDLTKARRVTADDHRAVLDFRWSDDPRHLLYLQDSDGDENHHLFRVALDEPDAPAVDLTPYPGVRVWRLHPTGGRPGSVVVDLNHRAPAEIDLCEIDVATGALTVLAQSDGQGAGWIATSAGEVYDLVVTEAGWEMRQRLPDGGLRTVTTFDGDDHPLGPEVWRPTPDGRGLWVGAFDGDRMALARVDLATGERTLVDRHPTLDLETRSHVAPLTPSALITDRRDGRLIGVRYSRERQEIRPLTDAFAEVLAALEGLSDGDVGFVESDESGRYWVVSFAHDREPASWWYDHATGEARLLFRPLGRVDPEALAPMVPVSVPARDGLEIVSYLTVPVGHDADEHAPPPMIVMPHGGPWTRDGWGLDLLVQYFATRGYAVLQPNFRGSTGFGRAHMQAAIGEFAGAMHDDLVDAVEWAVTHGHADPARVAIYGGSYGGYAVLVGVTETPHLFAAAVDYVGVSDLANFMRTIPEALRSSLTHNFHRYVGDPDVPEQEEEIRARSPITHLDCVVTPLMIFQGANDVRVVQAESDNVVDRLRGRGVEVAYRVFTDEGHGFVNPENLMTMLRESGAFLAEHLGGQP